MAEQRFNPSNYYAGAGDLLKNIQNAAKNYDKTVGFGRDGGGKKRSPGISTTMDPKLFPPAVPGGYTIQPAHARGSTSHHHPDLTGPKNNQVNKDYDKKQPGIQGSGDPQTYMPVDTSQSNNTPIITRSHNEEYVSKKQQWGDNPNIKAAADSRAEMAQAYRSGDPLAARPDALIPGSEAYMNTPDMKVWAGANKEAAKALRNKYLQSQDRQMARSGYTRGTGEIDRGSVDAAMGGSNGGLSNGPVGSRVTFKEDPTQTWKDLTGSETILDGQVRNSDLIKATQKGLIETRGQRNGLGTDNDRQTLPALNGEKANVVGEMKDVEEAAITDVMDQNPGVSRGQATDIIENEIAKPPVGDELISRIGASDSEVPNEAIDRAMERSGMQRNQAVDMVRSEEPMAHMTMGKRFTNPNANRAGAYMPLQRPTLAQAQFTGTRDSFSMQPPSGLNEATPVKSPLRYEQGNVHTRADEDLQRTDDSITADKFAWEINNNIGKRLFGEDYSPLRSRPVV